MSAPQPRPYLGDDGPRRTPTQVALARALTAWGPYGNADMLERAMFIGLANNLQRDNEVELALEACSFGGARVMALEDYGLEVGCHADVVLLGGESLADAVVSRPPRKLDIKRGRDGAALTAAP